MNLLSQRVADILSEKLPEQADTFASNAQAFESDLATVYSDFATQTAGKTAKEFIVFHDAYDYMFASASIDTELKRVFSEQLFGEIGTAHTQELIDAIAEHSIVHIYREPQMSDTALQNFATEYNLSVGVLDPIGQDASATGYIENIRSNLNEISQVYE